MDANCEVGSELGVCMYGEQEGWGQSVRRCYRKRKESEAKKIDSPIADVM